MEGRAYKVSLARKRHQEKKRVDQMSCAIVDGDLVIIPLRLGRRAIIQLNDYEQIKKYFWVDRMIGKTIYAMASASINGTTISLYMHRVILCPPNGESIDHKNHNGLDNRRCNLRLCTRAQNAANRGLPKNNTSGFKGVYWNGRKFIAQCYMNSKVKYLGSFDNAKEAAISHNKAVMKIYGEFACPNPI